jgi:hypothetical protein
MSLFCPRCGEPLQEFEGGLACIAGDMVLTKHMEKLLRAAYGDASGRTDNTPMKCRVGGIWFCPACGLSLAEDGGILGCQRCGRSLNAFIYHLIERHFHNLPTRN